MLKKIFREDEESKFCYYIFRIEVCTPKKVVISAKFNTLENCEALVNNSQNAAKKHAGRKATTTDAAATANGTGEQNLISQKDDMVKASELHSFEIRPIISSEGHLET